MFLIDTFRTAVASLLALVATTIAAVSPAPTPPTPAPPPVLVTIPDPTPPEPAPAAEPGVFGPWAQLIECESGGDPTADSGHGDYGLYQFRQPTWDAVARHLRRPELVGTWIPAQPVEVQTLFAETLRTMPGGGLGHWTCGSAYG